MKKIIIVMACILHGNSFGMDKPIRQLSSQLQKLQANLQSEQSNQPSTSASSSSQRIPPPPPLVPDDEDEPSTSTRGYRYETPEEGQEPYLTELPEEVLWDIIKKALVKDAADPNDLSFEELLQALQTLTNLSNTNKQLRSFINDNPDTVANYLKTILNYVQKRMLHPLGGLKKWENMLREHQTEWSYPVKKIVRYLTDEMRIALEASRGNWDVVNNLIIRNNFKPDKILIRNERLLFYSIMFTDSAVKMILDHGANPNFISALDLDSPLNSAIERNNIPIVKLLLESGALINDPRVIPVLITALDNSFSNECGLEKMIQFLLDNGADIKATDSTTGKTVLETAIAAYKPNESIIIKLIEHGAPLNQANHDGMTPLDVAIKYDNKKLIKLLKGKGADIDASDRQGHTNLMRAILKRNTELAKKLLKYGADINAQDDQGLTPLMHAILNGDFLITRLLLQDDNINLNIKNKGGETALNFAQRYGKGTLANLIKEKIKLINPQQSTST